MMFLSLKFQYQLNMDGKLQTYASDDNDDDSSV